VRFLGTFVQLAIDDTLVADADIRDVLERDARAVIDSLEGTARLPLAAAGR
jgi:hypothetical protein